MDITNLILDFMENMQPIFEAGTGLKNKLESEGWSPAVAEQIAATLVNEMIASALH